MKKYWFEFETEGAKNIPFGILIGCGVTAYDYADAREIINLKVFNNRDFLKIKKIVEDVDISKLDAGHVLPNMLSPSKRGIWFPIGYE